METRRCAHALVGFVFIATEGFRALGSTDCGAWVIAALTFTPGVAVVSGAQEETADTASCWFVDEALGRRYTFRTCCRVVLEGMRGDPRCWDEVFTYERCCVPELRLQVDHGLELLSEGSHRKASRLLFDLSVNFATPTPDNAPSYFDAWRGFEAAALKFRADLADLPKALTYREVLFDGLGQDCQPVPTGDSAQAGADVDSASVWDDFHRCCNEPFPMTTVCMQIFEMLMNAVGRVRSRADGSEDAYYGELSEQWAFRHFNPGIFVATDMKDGPTMLSEASDLYPGVANALVDVGEPTLGIVWADLMPGPHRSPKFFSGVWHLTHVLHAARADGRPLDVFEIGAGYGTLARLLAGSRQRLLLLEPPVDVRSYTAFDVQSVTALQHWYLARSIEPGHARLHHWPLEEEGRAACSGPWRTCGGPWGFQRADANVTGKSAEAEALWPQHRGAADPLVVHLVDRANRDLFVHLYSEANVVVEEAAQPSRQRPVRVLIAVNSWHEMPQSEWLWYYNEFVAGPRWRVAADWILYVSNQEWDNSDAKEALLMSPGPGGHRFETHWKECTKVTCNHVLRRVD
mmetsp:Transcript_28848/g.79510  ORF Transcript_28848/g.79510 Transcript_28848/m.79510 type:complete len:575 (+) Transcript_28848:109-1833(+)